MEGVLLRALVNNGPMALALEIFLRLDGPAQFRQSFESRRVLGQELVPCLLGPLQAGHVGSQSLAVRSQRELIWLADRLPRLSRLVEALGGFPHLPAGLAPAPRAERFTLRLPRCSSVVESGAASGLGSVARRCAGPTASALTQVSAVLFRERQKAPGVGQFARVVRQDRPGSCTRWWFSSASDLVAWWSRAQASRRSWPQPHARRSAAWATLGATT